MGQCSDGASQEKENKKIHIQEAQSSCNARRTLYPQTTGHQHGTVPCTQTIMRWKERIVQSCLVTCEACGYKWGTKRPRFATEGPLKHDLPFHIHTSEIDQKVTPIEVAMDGADRPFLLDSLLCPNGYPSSPALKLCCCDSLAMPP